MATLSNLNAVGFRGYLQQVRGAAIGIGSPAGSDPYSPTSMGTTTLGVGIITSGVTFNENPETLKVFADILRGPYDEIITRTDCQITFSLDQLSIWNFALGWSLAGAAVGASSSILNLDHQYLKNTGDRAGAANEHAGFHCAEIFTDAPPNVTTSANGTWSLQMWKVKVIGAGDVVFSGTDKTMIPVRIQCFVNDSDQYGQLVQSLAHTGLDYGELT